MEKNHGKNTFSMGRKKLGGKRTYSMSIESNDSTGKRVLICDITVMKNGNIEISSIDPSWHGRTIKQSALILSETGYVQKYAINVEVNSSEKKVINYII